MRAGGVHEEEEGLLEHYVISSQRESPEQSRLAGLGYVECCRDCSLGAQRMIGVPS